MYKTKSIQYMFCYSIEEVSGLLGVSEKTLRSWRSDGLKTIDDKQPFLIRGLDLIEYLKEKNRKGKKPTQLHELFCVSCGEPRTPYKREVTLEQQGKIIIAKGICSECKNRMRKPYSIRVLSELKKIYTVVDKLRLYDSDKSLSNFQINAKNQNENSEDNQGGLFNHANTK